MKSPFVSFGSNPYLRDAERQKGEAMLALKIQQTSDVGMARGYTREGKAFEASVIMSKYGALSQDGQFDPLAARETSQRAGLMRDTIKALVSAFPEVPGIEQALLMRNFSAGELQQLLSNKGDFKLAYEDWRKRSPNAQIGEFFVSPQFKVLGSKNFSYNDDMKLTGSPAEISAALVNQQVANASRDIRGNIDANSQDTNNLLQQLVNAAGGTPAVAGTIGLAPSTPTKGGPGATSSPGSASSASASVTPSVSGTNADENMTYFNVSAAQYAKFNTSLKTKMTKARKAGRDPNDFKKANGI